MANLSLPRAARTYIRTITSNTSALFIKNDHLAVSDQVGFDVDRQAVLGRGSLCLCLRTVSLTCFSVSSHSTVDKDTMKVFRCLLAAAIGVVLPASSVLASDAKHVRRGEADAAVEPLEQEGGGEGGRELTTCPVPLGCYPHLHFCTKVNFIDDSCEGSFYYFLDPSSPESICAIAEPTVIVAAHLYDIYGEYDDCRSQISSILYDLKKNGRTIRRFAEVSWPYTVFGDAPADPTQVLAKTLGPGVYTMTVTVKGPNRCVYFVQNYQFTISSCIG
jgi:hypothetical protein